MLTWETLRAAIAARTGTAPDSAVIMITPDRVRGKVQGPDGARDVDAPLTKLERGALRALLGRFWSLRKPREVTSAVMTVNWVEGTAKSEIFYITESGAAVTYDEQAKF